MDRLSRSDPRFAAMLTLGVGFVGLGLLFILAPRAGAALFGIASPGGEAQAYLPAIGLRDIALGLYLVVLTLAASRRAVGLLLAVTVLIPAGDIILVAVASGLVLQLLLHLVSGVVVGGAAWWLLSGPLQTA